MIGTIIAEMLTHEMANLYLFDTNLLTGSSSGGIRGERDQAPVGREADAILGRLSGLHPIEKPVIMV